MAINGIIPHKCLPKIVDEINALGGVEIERHVFKSIDLHLPGSTFQHGLFDM
jgi:hypothetical protein